MAEAFKELKLLLQNSHLDVELKEGFLSKVWSIGQNHRKSFLCGKSAFERANIRQWIEYRVDKLGLGDELIEKKNLREALEELDGYLLHHTYMAGYGLSLADVVLYYALHKYLIKMELTERSRFVNLSRWFSQVQVTPHLRPVELEHVIFIRNPNVL